MTAVDDARKRYERLMASDTSTAEDCTAAFNDLVQAQRADVERRSRALSGERIKAMSLDEFEAREAEIGRWVQAGAKDGEPAPAGPKRPAGHEWTPAEVQGLSTQEFALNEESILAQMPALGAMKAKERAEARARRGL